jgi:TonB family protein
MGYLALLFCPDEKTARTVTQVLGELEFTIESCIEPFAAVKKLMSQHFDAVVVDCDNEQNATLLFKSARNSTSNQASLAVAVVEGQAGVAKAFRIGANLVLTKPINIEQAKGTLRVARGLLRKGDPSKPSANAVMPAAAPVTPSAKPVGTSPVAAKPVLLAKPAASTQPAAAITATITSPSLPAPTPAVPAEVKPAPAWPAPAVASAASVTPGPAANPVASEDDLLEILDDSVSAPAVATRLDTQSVRVRPATAFEAQEAFNAALPPSHSGGAASAPAPAREVPAPQQASQQVLHQSPSQALHTEETSTASATAAIPAEGAHSDSSVHSGPEPSFTFGGANVAAEPAGANKKIFIGVAAAAIVGVALYVGWTKFQGGESQPVHTQTPSMSAPAAAPQATKPSAEKPTPATAAVSSESAAVAPVSSTPSPSLQHENVSAPSQDSSNKGAVSANAPASSMKPSNSAEPVAEPLIVKGGTAPTIHEKNPVADAPAPDMAGIATTGAGAPPPDLGGAQGPGAKPMLQTMKVSQGVSQGLLVKKVQPIYPKNALFMHVEGAVELMATISNAGDITHVTVLKGDGQLAKAAVDAVKQWKYKPYLLNGEPVEIQTEMTINFKLPN